MSMTIMMSIHLDAYEQLSFNLETFVHWAPKFLAIRPAESHTYDVVLYNRQSSLSAVKDISQSVIR